MYELCTSGWITHLVINNYQGHDCVRDYIVPANRIQRLLKNLKKHRKPKNNRLYLLRIWTKYPQDFIIHNIMERRKYDPWNAIAQP